MKHVIIGGVAGGATAAARIRRADEMAEIILIEKGEYISYANCGLPYYIGGQIKDRERLFVQTPEMFGKRFAIDVRTKNEAISIDTENKQITIKNANGELYKESYDKLLLSPGANAIKPPFPGLDIDGIFTLRNVNDTDKIKNYITSKTIKSAVVIGAGFIGIEMAENLHHAGSEVHIIEMGNQVMAPVDFSIAAHLHQHLTQKGVHLDLGKAVESFAKSENGIIVKLNDGSQIETDVVILSIGVRPETRLAKEANITLGETGGIKVDEYLETSIKDIYAVGDAIEYPHPITGKPWLNNLANPANRQGRIVADNMVFGNITKYEGAIGTAIAKVFDMTIAMTGLPAKQLKRLGIPYVSSTTHSPSNAEYYPNAMPLSLKLTFNPENGQIYGAQCVGYDGVDKRIDQIALIIKHNGTIEDLMKVEHSYAPPFSSAKDPIAIAGYTANNIKNGIMPIVTWRDIAEMKDDEYYLIDVRTADEYAFGTIKNAQNVPLDNMREMLDKVPHDKKVVLFCGIGIRGYIAQQILKGRGFKNIYNLSGGLKTYNVATAKIGNVIHQNNLDQDMGKEKIESAKKERISIDACGLSCPGPIMKVKKAIDTIGEGDQLEITSTDAAFSRDAEAWCNTTGNQFISKAENKGKYTVVIEKGSTEKCPISQPTTHAGKSFIMFSDDLDKSLATFILANGAAATGEKVTIFFTFWGLNVIKKENKPKVKKDIFGKMFGMMMPSSSKKLHLSKMSMFGIGDKMMRHVMKKKNIESLESLRAEAINNGVEFIACQMSMDVMGITKDELLDNVTIGGVATYMDRANKSNINLFI